MLKIKDLKCENLKNPIGIDEKNPRFSWKIESDKNDTYQTGYEITVENMWHYDTGKKESGGTVDRAQSLYVSYSGAPLKAKTKYKYKVRIYDNYGETSEYAEGFFITGLMGEKPCAEWIGDNETTEKIPAFVKKFIYDDKVDSAYIFASAYGLYEIYINGKRVGENYFSPGFTSYFKRLQYQMYDVKEYLKTGENTVSVYLGKGWCCGRYPFENHGTYLSDPSVMMQLEINKKVIIKTDKSWKRYDSPILFSEFYDGEIYDSGKENKFENENDVKIFDIGFDNLVWNCGSPVKVVEEIKPVSIFKTPKGETVIDFGQNMTGWAEMHVSGKSGDVIKISHAEVLDKDGNFYTKNMRTAKNEVKFILNGEKNQVYHPHFAFEGFRYIRIDECPFEVGLESFVGKVVCSDINISGKFESSNPLLNKLFSNILWGQKGNFVDIPTDCPQRDERAGWTGDAQVFMSTALRNSDAAAFFTKWLRDMKADQFPNGGVGFFIPVMYEYNVSAAWGDCAAVCPWELYKACGDKKFLAEMYPMMKKWVEYIRSQGSNEFLWNDGCHFGDWLGLDAEEGSYKGATDQYYIASAFFKYSVSLTLKAAQELGYKDDEKELTELLENIVSEFQKTYLQNDEPEIQTQTAYVLGLYMKLFRNPKAAAKKLADMINENGVKLKTGFVGTPYLCSVLSDNGYADIAYSLLLQQEYPSWLYPITKGATTIWEHWDGIKPDGSMWSDDMNSFNHYAYGSIGEWIYSTVCGINAASPAYKEFTVKPIPDPRLKYCRVEFETPYGTVSSGWEYEENGKINFSVTIPCNTTATIILPDNSQYKKGSGKYTFQI